MSRSIWRLGRASSGLFARRIFERARQSGGHKRSVPSLRTALTIVDERSLKNRSLSILRNPLVPGRSANLLQFLFRDRSLEPSDDLRLSDIKFRGDGRRRARLVLAHSFHPPQEQLVE